MTLEAYIPVLLQILLGLAICVGILLASHVFGQRTATNAIKDSAYECGLIAQGTAHPQFSVKFYVTAMLFILFDIEVVFLIPWVLTFRDFLAANISIILPVTFFLTILIIGLIYELRKGALKWE